MTYLLGEELFTFTEREQFLHSGARQKLVRAARGSSKTHSCVAQLVLGVPERGLYGLLAPNPNIEVQQTALYMTRAGTQARDNVWELFMRYLEPHGFILSANRHKGDIELINGTRLLIRGYGRMDLLQGLTVQLGVVYDEAQALDKETWAQIEPVRLRDGMEGWSVLAGRPGLGSEGIGCFFHEIERTYRTNMELGSEDYDVFVYDAGAVYDPDQIRARVRESGMAPDQIAREFFAEWVIDSKRAFYLFGEHNRLESQWAYDPMRPVGFGLDFNIKETSGIVYQTFNQRIVHENCHSNICRGKAINRPSQPERAWKSGEQCPHCLTVLQPMTTMAVIDEYHVPRGDARSQSEWIAQWLRDSGHRGKVLLAGDSSGNYGSTKDRHTSDWEIIKSEVRPVANWGMHHYQRTKNMAVRDSVNRVNSLFGENHPLPPRILIDYSNCPNLVRELGIAEKDKKGGLDKSGVCMANLVDSLRYAAEEEFRLDPRGATPLMITPI